MVAAWKVTRRVPLEQIPALIADGTISHSLVVSAFFFLTQSAGGWKRPAWTGPGPDPDFDPRSNEG